MRVPLHQLLVDQDPEQRNQQRHYHQQIPRQRRPALRMRTSAKRNQPRPAGRSRQRHPTHPVHPFMRKQRRPHSQNHRHRPHHQRSMAHRRNRQRIKLDQKLHRHAQKTKPPPTIPTPSDSTRDDASTAAAAAPASQTETGTAPCARSSSPPARSCRRKIRSPRSNWPQHTLQTPTPVSSPNYLRGGTYLARPNSLFRNSPQFILVGKHHRLLNDLALPELR